MTGLPELVCKDARQVVRARKTIAPDGRALPN